MRCLILTVKILTQEIVFYENADDIFDFIEQNQVFASRIGFIEALKGLTKNYDQDAFYFTLGFNNRVSCIRAFNKNEVFKTLF